MAGTTDTVKAMLTPGEFVIRKEAVDMIGVPILEKLNDMPEAGGHSEIDRLIAMATLKNMTGMYGGGNVQAYKHGGKVHGALKPVPNNNPGLAKLPEKVRNKMGYMQEGGSVLDMALRRAEPEFEDPEYQMVASYMTERPREYYDSPRFNEAQEYLMPEYKEFREATGNQFGFPEALLVDKLNIASHDYGRARGDSIMQRFSPFYAVQQWAERVDPEGEFQEGDLKDEVALKKLKRAYSDYIGTAEKASVQMGRMVYDANKNQFLRGNFPSAQKRKEQPIKDLNKSADKLTRLIQEIVYNRPIAREAMYDESNPPYIDGRNISNFFRGQREPIDQGSYDSGLMGMMKGGMAKKKKKYGYQDGGEVSPEMYTSMVRKLIGKLGGEEPEGMYTPEGGLTREGYAKMLGADPESISIDTLSFRNPANYMFKVSGKGAQSGADVGGTTQSRGILPLKGNILDPLMREKMDDPFERMDMEMLFRKIKPQGYQEGGAVQDSSMVRQPNPFVPFDQRPPSSGQVMSPIPRGMEQGDYYRSLRGELEMENEELVRDKAQNTLDRIRLDSLLNQVEESKMDSLLNQAPPINEMLRSLPDFPTIENPPRPTKTEFLKELLREGVII